VLLLVESGSVDVAKYLKSNTVLAAEVHIAKL